MKDPTPWTEIERNAWRQERYGSLSEWAVANIVLPKTTPVPGKLDLSLTPYACLPLDCILYPWTRRVTIEAGSQMFKTLLEIVFVLWAIDEHPTNLQFVMGRDEDAVEICKKRILPIIKASPRLRKYLTNERQQVTNDEINLNGATVFFTSARVAAEFTQRSIEFAVMDETHLFPASVEGEGSPFSLMAGRLSNYPGSKEIRASMPTDPFSQIHTSFNEGTQHHWQEACPYCHEYQKLLFSRIHTRKVDDAGRRITAEQIEADYLARYGCEHCGVLIEDRDKPQMLASGKWVSENKYSERPTHYSFRMPGMASTWRSFSGMYAQFLNCAKEPEPGEAYRSFFNGIAGEHWADQKNYLDAGGLEKAAEDGVLDRSVLPRDTVILTIGVDWHGARKGLYWLALAWTPGLHAWIVDYGQEFTEAALKAQTIQRRWETETKQPVAPWTGVDCGWGERDLEVYEYCKPFYPGAMATKGDDKVSSSAPVRPSAIEQKSAGKPKYQMKRLHINVGIFKDELARELRALRPQKDDGEDEDEKEQAPERPARLHLFRGQHTELIKHLTSERKVERRGGGGAKVEVWETKTVGAANHWLDCYVIARAIARYRGLTSTKAGAPAPARPQRPGRTGQGFSGYRRH